LKKIIFLISLICIGMVVYRGSSVENEINIDDEDKIIVNMEDISELYSKSYYEEEFRYFRTVFLVPKEVTEEEIRAYTECYIEGLREEYDDTYVVVLFFYDSEIYYKYSNNPVAVVS